MRFGATLDRATTVRSQTVNYVVAAVLYYVVAAIPVIVKMASDGELQLPKTLTLWLVAFSPFVTAIGGIVIAGLRGEPIPQPQRPPA